MRISDWSSDVCSSDLVLTRWFDNDVFGHVNNTIYYGWLDTAVCGWLMEVGLLEVEGEDLIGLVIETGCAYASPISFPQRVEIGLRVARIGNSSVTYHLGVFVEDRKSTRLNSSH